MRRRSLGSSFTESGVSVIGRVVDQKAHTSWITGKPIVIRPWRRTKERRLAASDCTDRVAKSQVFRARVRQRLHPRSYSIGRRTELSEHTESKTAQSHLIYNDFRLSKSSVIMAA